MIICDFKFESTEFDNNTNTSQHVEVNKYWPVLRACLRAPEATAFLTILTIKILLLSLF